jgi:hypothetical protein
LTYGQVKYFAHQAMTPWVSFTGGGGGPLRKPIPYFLDIGINSAIEGHIYKIRMKKTNKNIYKRKKYKAR